MPPQFRFRFPAILCSLLYRFLLVSLIFASISLTIVGVNIFIFFEIRSVIEIYPTALDCLSIHYCMGILKRPSNYLVR